MPNKPTHEKTVAIVLDLHLTAFEHKALCAQAADSGLSAYEYLHRYLRQFVSDVSRGARHEPPDLLSGLTHPLDRKRAGNS